MNLSAVITKRPDSIVNRYRYFLHVAFNKRCAWFGPENSVKPCKMAITMAFKTDDGIDFEWGSAMNGSNSIIQTVTIEITP